MERLSLYIEQSGREMLHTDWSLPGCWRGSRPVLVSGFLRVPQRSL